MPEFRDAKGGWITQSLFLETMYDVKWASYTLKEEDYEYKGTIYPSLKRLYLEARDITEYEFATKHLGGWQHWKKLVKNRDFMPHLEAWREELELLLQAEGIKQQLNLAKKGNANATRWVAERGWAEKKAGRPSKAQVEGETKRQASMAADIEEHARNIGLMN